MIKKFWTRKMQLELTINCMGQLCHPLGVSFPELPESLRSILVRAQNRRMNSINEKCIIDLKLMQPIRNKAKEGIDMNLLASRSLNHVYYSNSCPASLGGYSGQGHAWRFEVSDDLQF